MITERDIRNMTDYVLLNAYSVNSTGFYNGKAGLSLCLFEVARLLDDEYIEDHAFELLQEALLSKNEDIGFENGLSGIGHVFRYLIDNNFVHADFEELFGKNELNILNSLKNLPEKQLKEGTFLTTGYFLSDGDTFHSLITPFYEELCRAFSSSLISMPAKIVTYHQLVTFLKVLCNYPGKYDISALLLYYSELYNRGLIVSMYEVGYYIKSITDLAADKNISKIADENMLYSTIGTCTQVMTLSQRIDLLVLLRKNETSYASEIKNLESNLMEVSGKELEQTLVSLMNPSLFMAGYEGISRLLLYVVFLFDKKAGRDISRFDKLFK